MARGRKSARAPVRFWVVSAVIAIICAFAPFPAWMFEQFYSRDSFPVFQAGVTSMSNALPFAALDAMLGLAVVFVLYRLVRLVFVFRERGVLAAVSEAVRRTIRFAAVVTILFLFIWGFNYRRMPLEDTMSPGSLGQVDVARLTSAFDDANNLAARLRPSVQDDATLTYAATESALLDPLNQALLELDRAPLVTPGRVKHSVLVQPFFERAGYDGMINPLALETITHKGLLPFERPFVVAHEWAHLAGHADEAEASAVGWLACMKGGSALAYSASVYLIMQSLSAMPSDVRQKAMARLDPGVREDLAAISERQQTRDPRVQRTADRVYDEYLRANRVADGTASYGRALTLILSEPFRKALAGYR